MAITNRKGAYLTTPSKTYNSTTSASSQYTTLSANVGIVRVAVNQDTWISISSASTSTAFTANATLIPAGGVEFFAASASGSVAYLQVSTSGNISLSELQ
jgi:hypothetical protein